MHYVPAMAACLMSQPPSSGTEPHTARHCPSPCTTYRVSNCTQTRASSPPSIVASTEDILNASSLNRSIDFVASNLSSLNRSIKWLWRHIMQAALRSQRKGDCFTSDHSWQTCPPPPPKKKKKKKKKQETVKDGVAGLQSGNKILEDWLRTSLNAMVNLRYCMTLKSECTKSRSQKRQQNLRRST